MYTHMYPLYIHTHKHPLYNRQMAYRQASIAATAAAKKDDDPYANMDWEGLLKVADKRK